MVQNAEVSGNINSNGIEHKKTELSRSNHNLVTVKNLKKYFPFTKGSLFNRKKGQIKAVDDLSFNIRKGETLGVVGESGCGKSTTGRAILHLEKPTAGEIVIDGVDVTRLTREELRCMRPQIQMIFQDSYASLNPRHAIGHIISEPMMIHTDMKQSAMKERVMELLELVGLNPNHYGRFPHEFSGGQRQRINIARALSLNPKFVVCDEPISALDVSIQAQVINLFQDLQKELGLTYLFIAHDLSMVQHISDRVAVMYLGKIMELTTRERLFNTPLHPYTQALMSAIPIPDPVKERQRQRILLNEEVPSPANPPNGCVFNTRCPVAEEICTRSAPEYREIETGHFVVCHKVDAL
ncbi:oligopeptide transporter subunit; ATP-binding component of ABC superfamily [Desulfamplus magnetovallimortis]|uniref:Oligopeptide transporter subunit ATP-binding component of ABC superfamily n=1 Tax=Desulfamplus magnetovallimortis TaxID=1246637 RepID=A0A1W1HHR9_9BACT|nr:dipeptide ABC transporter ATP-binding protein [Desulfamplus magnetovallimortis]SLM31973.1 oligopeptide transporter subunit; ATP-binding component of ABC superfamily [Desulfamplus magnetovallimortis]